ncbi:hypothetical protein [Sandarakinorhabdus oryzae]|nr:hypothetical protein [Sandarakinorhabdus oryzae]
MIARRLSLLVLLLGLAMAVSVDRAQPTPLRGQPTTTRIDSLP